MSNRREFVTLLGGGIGWPLVAYAQQAQRAKRICVLMSVTEDDPEASARVQALELGLRKLGLVKGRDIRIEYRWGVLELDDHDAAQLVASAPEVILAHSPPTLAALQRATRTIPIVFVQAFDPVSVGLVNSLASPEGNITGFVLIEPSLGGKWLQLLQDLAPRTKQVLVVEGADNPSSARLLRSIKEMAPSHGIESTVVAAKDATDVEQSIKSFARPDAGLIVLPSPLSSVERNLIVKLAATYRLPAVYPFRYFAQSGGLMSYSADNVDQWRQAASYVDRILRGAQPRDLPIQLPTKFARIHYCCTGARTE
jgi:putative ABC transport system substrate-binding protein